MKVVAFADIPTGFNFPDIQPDLVLLLGDISYRNVLLIDHKYQCLKVGVLGNHDKAHFFDDTSVINIHGKIQTINGITFSGFQGCPRYNNKPFGQHLEIEAEAFVATIYDKPIDFFLAHSNPVYKEVSTNDESHRGFEAFNDLIQNQQVKHFFHGHLHEPFCFKIGKTTVHSVYPYVELEIIL
jgi:uncharacterized protein